MIHGIRAKHPDGRSWSVFWDAGEPMPADAAAKLKRLRGQGWRITKRFHENTPASHPSPED